MGFTPRDVDQMTVWEFVACCDGVVAANGVKPKAEAMADDRMAELGIEGF
jgi:hypothetical protein